MLHLSALRATTLTAVVCAALPAFGANYTYTVLNPPGIVNLTVGSINDAGEVVGTYYEAATNQTTGFIYVNGKMKTFRPPRAKDEIGNAQAINAGGTAIGTFAPDGNPGNRRCHKNECPAAAFPYTLPPNGRKAVITKGYPAKSRIYPYSINNSGEIAGAVVTRNVQHGYFYQNGAYTIFDPPGATSTVGLAINASGAIAGAFDPTTKSGRSNGFVLANGQYQVLAIKKADVVIDYINDAGDFGGYTHDIGYFSGQGFTDVNGVITYYDYPGALSTSIVRALSVEENFGDYFYNGNAPAYNYIYHYLNGSYYTIPNPVTGSGTPVMSMQSVNSTGSFTFSVSYPTQGEQYGVVAFCAAGPQQCTQ